MTIDEALLYGRTLLTTSPTAHLDARLLLQYVLQRPHSALIAHGDTSLTTTEESHYQQLVHRAQQHEPIPYLIGSAPFFDFELEVNSAVLIPRPETEQLVELVMAWTRSHPITRLADIGTGSGAIAIALARPLPPIITLEAVDISPAALAVARRNAERLAPGRIQFHLGDLLTPLSPGLDVMVANLPYVTDGEWTTLADGVKWYEPALALQGGPDGLDVIRRLLAQASSKLAPGGAIFLEIGWQQANGRYPTGALLFPRRTGKRWQADFAG
ncbi:MAG: peptide chain release factor N(5)-glutamine methyltransferase, partial [Anaerolineae bacterium]|nr:peptide chain release factor N(5)-glutamine methyltransferase [Anaerolineae bacterium]